MGYSFTWEAPDLAVAHYFDTLVIEDVIDVHRGIMHDLPTHDFSWLNIIEPGTDMSSLTMDVFKEKLIPENLRYAKEREKMVKSCWVVDPSQDLLMKLWEQITPDRADPKFIYFANETQAREWLRSL